MKHIASPVPPKAARPRIEGIHVKFHVYAGPAHVVRQILVEPNEMQRISLITVPATVRIRIMKHSVASVLIYVRRLHECIEACICQNSRETLSTCLIYRYVRWTHA